MISSQALLFLIFSLNGVIIGLIFDFFRILRKSFRTTNCIIYIQDILFWILTGISIIFFMYNFSEGSIRLFIFMGLILGFLLYILTISKYIIKTSVYIILLLKILIKKLLIVVYFPIRVIKTFIHKTIIRHFYILFLKIQQIFIKYFNKLFSKNVKKNVN